ncbi:MAG: PAS domain S-box protein, partial [Actinomycetota bacterium]|nr:PAS domain S-box protein [Actinomycetota bacterium]
MTQKPTPHSDDPAVTAAMLAAIVESSNDAILAKDCDALVTVWNPACERLYGYTAEEMIGQSIARIIPRDRADELAALLERLGRGERIEHYQTERVHKDGHRLAVSISIAPIADASGEIVGAATIGRDITQRIRVETAQRFLAKVNPVLVASLDVEAIVTDVAHLVVPTLADSCAVL